MPTGSAAQGEVHNPGPRRSPMIIATRKKIPIAISKIQTTEIFPITGPPVATNLFVDHFPE
jgi:hypothetical protein